MSDEIKAGNPYVGARPFVDPDRQCFFGRELECRIVSDLVRSRRAVLMYAPAGAGKTSLLQAAVLPDLAGHGTGNPGDPLSTIPSMRVLGFVTVSADAGAAAEGLRWKLQPWSAPPAAAPPPVAASLAELVTAALSTQEQASQRLGALLVFDRMELLFSEGGLPSGLRQSFFQQIASVLAHGGPADPKGRVRFLFSMREEFVAELTPYEALLPDQLRARYRLERLGVPAALDAIVRPAEHAGRRFAPGVAEALVEDLRRIQRASVSEALADYVEPVQLQIVCAQLWDALPPAQRVIGDSDRRQFADIDQTMQRFYEQGIAEVLRSAANADGAVCEQFLRDWFETELITVTLHRQLVVRGERETQGVANAVLDELERRHLLHEENRGGVRVYELAYGRLATSVLAANRAWRSQHAFVAATAAWEAAGRPRDLLYRGAQLRQAETVLAAQAQRFLPVVRQFVTAGRADERRRWRRLAGALVGVALGSLLAGLFAWLQQRAQHKDALLQLERAYSRQLALLSKSVQLAAQAHSEIDNTPERAKLLAIEAHRLSDNPHTRSSLMEAALASGGPSSRQLHGFDQQNLEVTSVAFSAEGKSLIATARTGASYRWQLDQGRPAGTLLPAPPLPAPESLRMVLATPDAQRLALIVEQPGNKFTLQLADRGGLSGRPSELPSFVFASAASKNGAWFATAHQSQLSGRVPWKLRLWPTNGGVWQELVEAPDTSATAVLAFSADGKTFAAADRDAAVRLWDTARPEQKPLLLRGAGSAMHRQPEIKALAIAGSDGSQRVAASLSSGDLIVWTQASEGFSAPTYIWRGQDDSRPFTKLAFSTDGRRLAAVRPQKCAPSAQLHLFDFTRLSQNSRPIVLQGSDIRSLAWSADDRQIATSDANGRVVVWELADEEPQLVVPPLPGPPMLVSMSYDQSRLAWTNMQSPREIHVRRLGAGDGEQVQWTTPADPAGIVLSDDGRWLAATIAQSRSVIIWDLEAHKELPQIQLAPLSGDNTFNLQPAFSTDGRLLSLQSGTAVRILDFATGFMQDKLRTRNVNTWTLGPDSLMPLDDANGRLALWDARSGQRVGEPFEHIPEVDAQRLEVAWLSPDRRWLAAADGVGALLVWDVATRRLVGTRLGHGGSVDWVEFSPTGSMVVIGSGDQLQLFDLKSGLQLGPNLKLPLADDLLKTVRWSPDEASLTAGTRLGAVYRWHLDVKSQIERSCKTAARNLTASEWRAFLGSELPPRCTCDGLDDGPGGLKCEAK